MNGNVQLVEAIYEVFNEEEMRTLCFTIGIEYDDIRGATRKAKSRELVDWCDRRGMTAGLLMICKEARPNVNWKEVMKKTPLSASQSFLPRMTQGATNQLAGMQIALIIQRQNKADKGRFVNRVMFAALLISQIIDMVRS